MWEAHLIRQHLYDAGAANSKFVPILFSDGLDVHIPTPVRGASIYRIETDDGYISLYRLLTNQPLVPLPPLGQIKILQSDGSVSADSNDERFRSHQKALEKVKQLEVEGLLLPTDRASMNEVIRSRMLKEWGY